MGWKTRRILLDLGVRIKEREHHKYSRPFQAVEATHPDLGLNLEEWESKRVKLVLERLGLGAEVFPRIFHYALIVGYDTETKNVVVS
jgi:hypothetical protein